MTNPVAIGDLSDVIREFWKPTTLQEFAYFQNPLYAMCAKNHNAKGNSYQFTIEYGRNPGRSRSFVNAQANANYPDDDQFDVPYGENYAIMRMTTKAIRGAAGDGSIIRNLIDKQGKNMSKELGMDYGRDVYGDGTGTLGVADGIPAANYVTLTNPTDIVNFFVGQVLVTAPSIILGLNNAGATAIVTGVDRDRDTARVLCGAGWQGAMGDGHIIFTQGDYAAASDKNKIYGLKAWLPADGSRPVIGESFFGVDRSADDRALAGQYYDGSAQPIDEAILDGLNDFTTYQINPDCLFINPRNMGELSKIIGSDALLNIKVPIEAPNGEVVATVGFTGYEMAYNGGLIKVVPDRSCPVNLAYPLTMDDWELVSLGPEAGWLDEDEAGRILRMPAADAYEGRAGGYPAFGTECPGRSGVITLPS